MDWNAVFVWVIRALDDYETDHQATRAQEALASALHVLSMVNYADEIGGRVVTPWHHALTEVEWERQ